VDRRARLLLVLVLLLACALGVQAVLEWQASPYGAAPMLDEEGYIRWARAIAGGEVRGDAVFYQDPLYPYLLALALRLSGGALIGARLLQVGLGAVAVAATFGCGRRLFGVPAGLLAALLVALHGVHIYSQAELLKEPLATALTALFLWLGVRADAEERRRDWLGLGIALGLLSLLRGNALAFLPVAAAWAWLRPAGRARGAALVLCGAALAIAPVTLRNLVVGRELVLTTAQAGPNFYIGNNPLADGTYAALPFVRASPEFEARDFRAEAIRRTGRELTASDVSRFWWREALAWMREHPAQALRLWLRKAWLVVDSYEVPDNESFACMRAHFMPSLWVGFVGMGLLLGPAVVGAALWARRGAAALPALFALVYAGTLVAFFVVSRYRLPLVPPLAIFAARLLVAIHDELAARRVRSALAMAGAAALVGALAHLPSPPRRLDRVYQARCALTSGTTLLSLGRPAEALPLLEEAARLQPAAAVHRYNLGVALQRLGDAEGATGAYREALRLDPSDRDARKNLVLLLVQQGRCADAAEAARAASDPALSLASARCVPGRDPR
jgi:4-amino-4-deoxy-L-arabinose transferase-like glycosyltransferase